MATLFDLYSAPGEAWIAEGRPGRFEKYVAEFLRKCGHRVLTRGWPDLLVISPSGKVSAIELKQGGDKLSDAQREMSRVLNEAGLPTWCVSANSDVFTGFVDNFYLLQHIRKRNPKEDFNGLGMS